MRLQNRSNNHSAMRETLHELANSLASARIWLVVLGNAPPLENHAASAEALAKVHRLIGDAEESCLRLGQLIPRVHRGRKKK